MRFLRVSGVHLVLSGALAGAACQVYHPPRPEPVVAAPGDLVNVASPLKVHLADLSTVFFPRGARVSADTIWGWGERWGPRLELLGPVHRLAMDSVLGVEAMHGGLDRIQTVMLSTLAAGLGTATAAVLAVAIFGSCPTVYADAGAGPVLQAESFSYSIAPLLEARDVDALPLAVARDGRVTLEVRNEALETHYINHLELLAVEHAPGERIVPDPGGEPVALENAAPPVSARDRAGRDVGDVLARPDGEAYASDAALLATAAGGGDVFDHVDLVLPPVAADSAALLLGLRNSLLNTMLFYDMILAPGGATAVDWIAGDLGRIGSAVETAAWYRRWMGLRVAVEREGAWEPVAHLPDVGPIAWKAVAVPVAVQPGVPTRVRLSFLADQWRIDEVAWFAGMRRPAVGRIAPDRILASDGTPDPAALTAVAEPDEGYLETRPGQVFSLGFDVGTNGAGERSFLLAAQGYYTEWLRRDWLRNGDPTARFEPSEAVIRDLLARWIEGKDDLEARFFASAIPVR